MGAENLVGEKPHHCFFGSGGGGGGEGDLRFRSRMAGGVWEAVEEFFECVFGRGGGGAGGRGVFGLGRPSGPGPDAFGGGGAEAPTQTVS